MSNIQRIQPPFFQINDPVIPEVILTRLDNNIPVYTIESGTEDVSRIEFIFRAGQINESLPLLASSANQMLMEGSEKHSSVELKRLIDYYGSFINLSAEKDSASLVIYLLNKHMDKVLQLGSEILFNPLFAEDELSALMKKRLNWFRINRQKVQNLSMDQFFESVFGKNHPYGRKAKEEDFENLRSSDLKEFHSRYYASQNLTILVSGKIHPKTLTSLNQFFGNIPPSQIPEKLQVPAIKGSRKKKVLIAHSGALQSSIRLGSSTINKRHPDYPGLKIIDAILGGYFGSRLMKNIREEKGFTYGINSYVTSFDLSGYKLISTDVGIEHTQKTIDEIYKEIRLLQTAPVSNEELNVVRNFMLGDLVRMFDGPFACADTFKSVWEFGLDYTYHQRLSDRIKKVTQDEITSLASTYYKLEDLYEITAGSL